MDAPLQRDWISPAAQARKQALPESDISFFSNALTAKTNGEAYEILKRHGVQPRHLNQGLQAAGYDGITHTGGGRTGNEAHRVWIAFNENQIFSPYERK
jgi:hypothetical protein